MSMPNAERRNQPERRRAVLHALWHGNFARRRRAPRRGAERHVVVTDWFDAQWLALVVSILLLSVADAFLTLTLISHGASELNPFMDPLVRGSGHGFAFWKIGLTAAGLIVLATLSRLRVWGWIVGNILYVALAGYVVLVIYELFLLRNIPID